MSKKFQNIYRIESNRLKNWDYAQEFDLFHYHLHEKHESLLWENN